MEYNDNIKDGNEFKSRGNDKPTSKRLKFLIIGFIVLIAAVTALVLFLSYNQSYIATVGGERISTEEFKFFLKQEKYNMLTIAGVQEGTPEEESFWNSKIDGESAIDVAKKKSLEQVRELKIQVAKAKEANIKLEKSDLESIENGIKDFIAQNNNSKTEANRMSVELFGVKLDELKDIYKEFILMQKLIKKEYEGTEISEDDIPSYYEEHPEWYNETQFRDDAEEAVWAKHILIRSSSEAPSEAPAEEQDKARKKAEEILEKAKNGEDFAKLAMENSEDAGSAMFGGDYVFGRGKMDPAFEEKAFSLKPGEISDLVETNFGYHIIKLEEKFSEGQPVSVRCAKEYWEFGVRYISSKLYDQKLEEWKKDPNFVLEKNKSVYDSIK